MSTRAFRTVPVELCVATRHGNVIEGDVAVRRSADRQLVSVEQEPVSGSRGPLDTSSLVRGSGASTRPVSAADANRVLAAWT